MANDKPTTNAEMNRMLRTAAFGVSEDELDEQIEQRKRQRKAKSMNALLHAARGVVIPEEEGDN